MIWLLAITVGLTMASGAYLAQSRDALRCLVGLSVMGSAVNLLLFSAGRLSTSLPPLIATGSYALGTSANPLPQALVLTAIVIGLALICFGLVLLLGIVRVTDTDDITQMRFAEPEPEPDDPFKPALTGRLDSESDPEILP